MEILISFIWHNIPGILHPFFPWIGKVYVEGGGGGYDDF